MSRRELTKRAKALADELGHELEPQRMSNAQLEDAIDELSEQKREADALPEGPARIEEPEPSPLRGQLTTTPRAITVGGPPRYAYQVAPGHSIKCRRGLLRHGHEVRAEWIGGEEELQKRVESGAVLRGPLARGDHRQV